MQSRLDFLVFFLRFFYDLGNLFKFSLEEIEIGEQVTFFEPIFFLRYFISAIFNLLNFDRINNVVFQSLFEELDLVKKTIIQFLEKSIIVFLIDLCLIFDFLCSFCKF